MHYVAVFFVEGYNLTLLLVEVFASFYFLHYFMFLMNKAELQKQQQQLVAQKLIAAQRHVAVTHQPQPQKATIVYRSQQVPSNDQPIPKSSGEGRQRSGRSGRHDGRYTSGKRFA